MKQDFTKYQEGEPQGPDDIEDGVIISSDTCRKNRMPPGQVRTRKWPVLQYGDVAHVPKTDWRLRIFGCVENELKFDWDAFRKLPRVKVFSDFHCVTRWSRLGNMWEGVATRHIAELANVTSRARYAILHGYDNGWSTNVPLDEFLSEDALLCDTHDGEPISDDHGGPVRAVIPLLYAWKSAKWLKAIEFSPIDKPGYWERVGYHNHGDPWTEERYGW